MNRGRVGEERGGKETDGCSAKDSLMMGNTVRGQWQCQCERISV
jgi:hypothetical protein